MKVQKPIILQNFLIFYGILVYGLCIYFRNMCPGNDKYKKSLNLKHTTLLQMTALTLNRI